MISNSGKPFLSFKCNSWVLQMALLVGALALTVNTYAHGTLDIVSGKDWKASTSNANDSNGRSWTDVDYVEGPSWTQAFSPYPNGFAIPRPNQNGSPTHPDQGTTNAQLMWYSDKESPTGWNGPTTAYFRYSFDFNERVLGPGAPFLAWVGADDWMTLYVNGSKVTLDDSNATYILEKHQDPLTNLPDFVLVDFDNLLNKSGQNVLAIEAHDGDYPNSGEREYEWVFFDAQLDTPEFNFNTPLMQVIPEPQIYAMLLAGLALVGWLVKRREQPRVSWRLVDLS